MIIDTNLHYGHRPHNLTKKLLNGCTDNTFVIRIALYADDFETGNALGSKAGLHKLCGLYFSINNFGIIGHDSFTYMFGLFYSLDINNTEFNGIDIALEPFVKEMKNLASPKELYVGNEKITVLFRMVYIIGEHTFLLIFNCNYVQYVYFFF